MAVKTIVESVSLYTCDGCGTEVELSASSIEPIADWIAVQVQAIRSRPGEKQWDSKNFCGTCAEHRSMRPGRDVRS